MQHVRSAPNSPRSQGANPPRSPVAESHVDALAKQINFPFYMPANGYQWSRRQSRVRRQNEMTAMINEKVFSHVPEPLRVPVLMKISEGSRTELLITRLVGEPLFTKLLQSMICWAQTRSNCTKSEYAKTLAWFERCLKLRALRTYDSVNTAAHLNLMSELVTLFLDNKVCRFNQKVRILVRFAQLYPTLMGIIEDNELPESLLPLARRIFEAEKVDLKFHYPSVKEAASYSLYLHTWLRHSKLPKIEQFLLPFIKKLPIWFYYFVDTLPLPSEFNKPGERYTFIPSQNLNPFHPCLSLQAETLERFSLSSYSDSQTTVTYPSNSSNSHKVFVYTNKLLRAASEQQRLFGIEAGWVLTLPRRWLTRFREHVVADLRRAVREAQIEVDVLACWVNFVEAEVMYLEDSDAGKAAFKSGFEDMHSTDEIQEWIIALLEVNDFLSRQTEYFNRNFPGSPYTVAQAYFRKFVSFLQPKLLSYAVTNFFGHQHTSHITQILPAKTVHLHDRWDSLDWVQLGKTLFSPPDVVRYAKSDRDRIYLKLTTPEQLFVRSYSVIPGEFPSWKAVSAQELMSASRETQVVTSSINANLATVYKGSSMSLSRYTRFHKKSPITTMRSLLGVSTTVNHNKNKTIGGHYLFIWRANKTFKDTDWWLINQQTKKLMLRGKTKLDLPPAPHMNSEDPRLLILPSAGPALVLTWPEFEAGRAKAVTVQIAVLKSRKKDVMMFRLPEGICHCRVFDFVGPWMLLAVGYTLYAFDWRKMSTPTAPGSDLDQKPHYHKIPLILGEIASMIVNSQKSLVVFVPKVGNSIAIMDVSHSQPPLWKTSYIQVIKPKFTEVDSFNQLVTERDPYFQLSAASIDPDFKYLIIKAVSRLKYMVYLEEPINRLKQAAI